MKHCFFYATVLFALLISSCHKNPPVLDNPYGLPDATQTGTNIFACRVNDSNWTPGFNPTSAILTAQEY